MSNAVQTDITDLSKRA